MYLEKVNNNTYITVNKDRLKEQALNVVGNLLGWIAAGVMFGALVGAVYYGNVCYQLLTTLI